MMSDIGGLNSGKWKEENYLGVVRQQRGDVEFQ